MTGKKINVTARRAALGLLVAGGLALAGCSHGYNYYRPSVSSFQPGDVGLQSRDLVDMTGKLAADLLTIPAIANNPNKVIIVMGSLHNETSTPWTNDQIYLARMRALLNQYARDRIAFVLPLGQATAMQQKYLGGAPKTLNTQTGTWQSPTLLPQYVLNGTFYDLPNAATTYYLCTFKLVDIHTGELVWERKYEVRTLNFGD